MSKSLKVEMTFKDSYPTFYFTIIRHPFTYRIIIMKNTFFKNLIESQNYDKLLLDQTLEGNAEPLQWNRCSTVLRISKPTSFPSTIRYFFQLILRVRTVIEQLKWKE